jgi:hypothetical protein
MSRRPRYEGLTGIAGIILDVALRRGMAHASPHGKEQGTSRMERVCWHS